MTVVVVGAGGHARVIASLLACRPDLRVAGVLDRTREHLGETVGALTVIGDFASLDSLAGTGIAGAILALGDNAERAAFGARCQALGLDLVSLVHPSALIEADVVVPAGAVIAARVVAATGVRLGTGCIINTGAIIDHESSIGDYAHVAPGCCLAGRVRVGRGAFVGIGARVAEKRMIGDRSIVGAGAVVVSDIPDDVIAYGVPAKVQRHA